MCVGEESVCVRVVCMFALCEEFVRGRECRGG
jgi:hypothetical protein